jgi:hypothetical protein
MPDTMVCSASPGAPKDSPAAVFGHWAPGYSHIPWGPPTKSVSLQKCHDHGTFFAISCHKFVAHSPRSPRSQGARHKAPQSVAPLRLGRSLVALSKTAANNSCSAGKRIARQIGRINRSSKDRMRDMAPNSSIGPHKDRGWSCQIFCKYDYHACK